MAEKPKYYIAAFRKTYRTALEALGDHGIGEADAQAYISNRNEGAKGIGPIAVPNKNRNAPETLADLGLDKKTSSRAQQLAALPDDAFEQVKDGTLPISTALRLNRPIPARPRGPTRQNVQQARQSATAARRQMEEEQRALSTKVWGLQDALTHVVSVLSSSKPDQLAQYRESLLDVARQAHHDVEPSSALVLTEHQGSWTAWVGFLDEFYDTAKKADDALASMERKLKKRGKAPIPEKWAIMEFSPASAMSKLH